MQNDSPRPGLPAKLPAYSRAAAAQRLDERPQSMRGVYYPVPHRSDFPKGLRTRRHIKRKYLRRSNEQYAATDRVSTGWAMLPLAFGVLITVLVLATLLITFKIGRASCRERV